MPFNRPALLILLLAVVSGPFSRAEDKVWSAVVLASNAKPGEKAKPAAAELVPFVSKLSSFFGYDQFEVLGSAVKSVGGSTERWLVPTPNFWLGAKAVREGADYHLNIEFFHDKRLLLETEAKLGPNSPIFVRGPMHARGQVILVFEIKP
jgi:hypothetical protein